ncbi:MAG TPA: serine hydrolase [Flavobacterium sp.]|uniref:serine hydrolase n=1 Tax=unclassified Flavobacterium TaxID=196869 RepID=UPI000E8F3548|nr:MULTISPECIES: serine hydrolase [unclassified Flavobacterium]HBI01981.1 serine hydrolase [Flavobacterium sp.]HRE78159.1 serine hydrolase [Flavobacterium sp.]
MKTLLFLLLVGCTTSVVGQELYFPPNTGTAWETTPPSTLGYCPEKIAELYTLLEENQSKAFLLLKDGKIVLEQYFDGFQPTDNWYWASAGKTITAFTVGIAQQEGFLSIEDTSADYLGEGWTTAPAEKEQQITIKNQLNMTSGLDYTVPNLGCTDPECLEYLSDAGSQWYYHNAPYTLLDQVIETATSSTLNQYFSQKVRNPIGMNGAFIQVEENNVYFSTPRSMARFGLLMLNGGSWGTTPIMTDTNYFNEMINTSQSLNLSYGYLWWLNGKSSYMLPGSTLVFPGFLIPDAPADTYVAAGKNGQFLNITPSEGLVWVRMGDTPDDLLVPFFLNNQIWEKINELVCPLSTTDSAFKKWQIAPNPVKDQLLIQNPTAESYNWELYDSSSQILEKGNQQSSPTLTGYANGFYWLKIQSGNDVQWEKVIKK